LYDREIMRGPLLSPLLSPLTSGAIGSAASLRRLVDRLRPFTPVVVVRSLWLAAALARELPVLGLLPPADRAAAVRSLRRSRRKPRAGAPAGGALALGLASAPLPLAPGAAGALVLEDLAATSEQAAAEIARLLPLLRPGGLLVSADRTRDPALEADLAGAFLALGLTHITQDRPRDGALLTSGRAPHPAVAAALAGAARAGNPLPAG
jgi:hypothetical protein